ARRPVRRARRRRQRDGAGGVSLHHQPAGLVGVVRRNDRGVRWLGRDVAGRGRIGRRKTVARGIRGAAGGECRIVGWADRRIVTPARGERFSSSSQAVSFYPPIRLSAYPPSLPTRSPAPV